jgi:hypothetical protein
MRRADAELRQQRLVHVGVIAHRVFVDDGLVGKPHAEHVRRDHGEPLGKRVP